MRLRKQAPHTTQPTSGQLTPQSLSTSERRLVSSCACPAAVCAALGSASLLAVRLSVCSAGSSCSSCAACCQECRRLSVRSSSVRLGSWGGSSPALPCGGVKKGS